MLRMRSTHIQPLLPSVCQDIAFSHNVTIMGTVTVTTLESRECACSIRKSACQQRPQPAALRASSNGRTSHDATDMMHAQARTPKVSMRACDANALCREVLRGGTVTGEMHVPLAQRADVVSGHQNFLERALRQWRCIFVIYHLICHHEPSQLETAGPASCSGLPPRR